MITLPSPYSYPCSFFVLYYFLCGERERKVKMEDCEGFGEGKELL